MPRAKKEKDTAPKPFNNYIIYTQVKDCEALAIVKLDCPNLETAREWIKRKVTPGAYYVTPSYRYVIKVSTTTRFCEP